MRMGKTTKTAVATAPATTKKTTTAKKTTKALADNVWEREVAAFAAGYDEYFELADVDQLDVLEEVLDRGFSLARQADKAKRPDKCTVAAQGLWLQLLDKEVRDLMEDLIEQAHQDEIQAKALGHALPWGDRAWDDLSLPIMRFALRLDELRHKLYAQR